MEEELKPRKRILNTARDLFIERGYQVVGINEIIDKSDVARATFYNHFQSKENLCLEWLNLEKEASLVENAKILQTSGDYESRLKRKYTGLIDYLRSHQFRGCPFSNTLSMTSDSKPIADCVKSYKEDVKEFWVSLAEDSGKGRGVGEALFLLYSGATTEAQNSANALPVEMALEASLEMLS